jgi:hypothetical protein
MLDSRKTVSEDRTHELLALDLCLYLLRGTKRFKCCLVSATEHLQSITISCNKKGPLLFDQFFIISLTLFCFRKT